MIGAMPDTRGRGAGDGGQNPTGTMDVANRKGISPRPVEPPPWRARCIERCPAGSGRGSWVRLQSLLELLLRAAHGEWC